MPEKGPASTPLGTKVRQFVWGRSSLRESTLLLGMLSRALGWVSKACKWHPLYLKGSISAIPILLALIGVTSYGALPTLDGNIFDN